MDVRPNRSVHAPSQHVPQARRSAALLLLAAVLFGTAGTARAIAAPNASNVSVGAMRALFGGLSLLVSIPFLGGSRARSVSLWRRPPVLFMGLAAALYQMCFYGAVGTSGVALGTLITVGSAPVVAGLLGWAVLGFRPSVRWAIATTVAIAGLALLSSAALGGASGGLGVALALGASVSLASYNVATKSVIDDGADPMELTAAAFTLAGILLLPALLTQSLSWLATPGGLALVLYLGVVTVGVANTWLARGVHALGPGPASTLMLAEPVTATLLGVVVLNESITGAGFAGSGWSSSDSDYRPPPCVVATTCYPTSLAPAESSTNWQDAVSGRLMGAV